jgi:hypothetical protein
MEDADINPDRRVSDWQPITKKSDLAHLGKLGEEVCECGASIFRCIIQGVEEAEPTTGKINRIWLEDEIADVQALMDHVILKFGLNKLRIEERRKKKFYWKLSWFVSLEKVERDANDK